MNNMKKLSYFRLILEDYLLHNHPDKFTDTAFIDSRSEQAELIFEQCSKEGLYISECREQANNILLEDLHYSLFCKIQEVIEDNFGSNVVDEMDLYNSFKDSITRKYDLSDNYSGSAEEQTMIYELIGLIQIHIEKHGLQ